MEENQIKNKHSFTNLILDDTSETKHGFNVKVIGVGGAGCNIVEHIALFNPTIQENASLYAFNTDLGSLKLIQNVENRLLLNKDELKGYGSGGNPEVGRHSVAHDANIIKDELKGTDLLIIVTGLGKGTGSGGSPELAKLAKEMGILTVAIVSMPSTACEGNIVYNNAFNALQNLMTFADSITTISSERIISANNEISFYSAYELANEETANIVEDLVSIIFKPSIINIDFADLRTFFKQNKFFISNRLLIEAENVPHYLLKEAISKKVRKTLSDVNIENAKQALCNITISKNTQTNILNDLKKAFSDITKNDALNIVTGVNYNSSKNMNISFLISGSSFATDFTSEYTQQADAVKFHEPTTSIDQAIENYDILMKELEDASRPTEDILNKQANKQ